MASRLSTCPHCGKPWPTPQRAWQLEAQAAGRCLRCNRPKADPDATFRNCRPCRIVIAAHARARYAQKTACVTPFEVASRGRQVSPRRGAA